MNAIYYPVLRLKRGELVGVAELTPLTVSRTRPIFDLLNPTPRESLEQAQNAAMISIAGAWGAVRPFYLDVWRYALRARTADGRQPIEHLFKCASQLHLKAIPMAGSPEAREDEYLRAIATIARDRNAAGIRLFLEDFETPGVARRTLDDVLRRLDLNEGDVEVFLDFGSRSRTQHVAPRDGDLEAICEKALSTTLEYKLKARILSGTSVPEQVGSKFNREPCRTTRVEFAIWKRLAGNEEMPLLRFGDYAAITPLQSDTGGGRRPPARVRLATEDELVSFRADPTAYRALCAKVVDTTEFAQQLQSSWGVAQIRRTTVVKEWASPTDMVARDTNMHVEMTCSLLQRRLRSDKRYAALDFAPIEHRPVQQVLA